MSDLAGNCPQFISIKGCTKIPILPTFCIMRKLKCCIELKGHKPEVWNMDTFSIVKYETKVGFCRLEK